eukprot:Pgem_evm1s9181
MSFSSNKDVNIKIDNTSTLLDSELEFLSLGQNLNINPIITENDNNVNLRDRPDQPELKSSAISIHTESHES